MELKPALARVGPARGVVGWGSLEQDIHRSSVAVEWDKERFGAALGHLDKIIVGVAVKMLG